MRPITSSLPLTSVPSGDHHYITALPIESAIPFVPLTETEPLHPHAYLTFGAGMKQKGVDVVTAKHPLGAESGNATFPCSITFPCEFSIRYLCSPADMFHASSSAHPVGSSVMLLGGFGFISRLYGLSIDNLVEVEMVLADGRIVIVNREALI
jgi:hypothetical protein